MRREIDPITHLLNKSAAKPYRDLIQRQIRSFSSEGLLDAYLHEAGCLSQSLQSELKVFIGLADKHLGNDQEFWEEASCAVAVFKILRLSMDPFPPEYKVQKINDAVKSENPRFVLSLIKLVTLNFAYSASTRKERRKLMGIRKGPFAGSAPGTHSNRCSTAPRSELPVDALPLEPENMRFGLDLKSRAALTCRKVLKFRFAIYALLGGLGSQ